MDKVVYDRIDDLKLKLDEINATVEGLAQRLPRSVKSGVFTNGFSTAHSTSETVLCDISGKGVLYAILSCSNVGGISGTVKVTIDGKTYSFSGGQYISGFLAKEAIVATSKTSSTVSTIFAGIAHSVASNYQGSTSISFNEFNFLSTAMISNPEKSNEGVYLSHYGLPFNESLKLSVIDGYVKFWSYELLP